MGRVIGIIVGVLVLFWIISQPEGAADTVNDGLALLAAAGNSFITFLQNLF